MKFLLFYCVLIIACLCHLTFCANVNKAQAAPTTTKKSKQVKELNESDSSKISLEDDEKDGPIRISLPTITPNPIATAESSSSDNPTTIKLTLGEYQIQTTLKPTSSMTKSTPKAKQTTKSSVNNIPAGTKKPKIINGEYTCPKDGETPFQLFPRRCQKPSECSNLGKSFQCCKQYGWNICVKGKLKPILEQKHEPILGLIPRKCPTEPLAELWWELQTCKTDVDCWPRVCCPDGRKSYCRTAKPQFDSASFRPARQLSYPFEAISGYLQCTPAPPPLFDTHPKPCNNTLDCFPNVCCQESGKKHCRPPKRSLLALLTSMTQGFGNIGFIKQWTDNLVIR